MENSAPAAERRVPLEWNFQRDKDPSFSYEDGPHLYRFQKGVLISCTGIIKAVGWEDDRFYTPGSADRGTRVHAATAAWDQGQEGPELSDEELGYLLAWKKFVGEWCFCPRLIESPIYHKTLLYGVTADREGLILKGRPAIVEIKSGAMKWWTKYQAAMQDMAIQSWQDKPQFRMRVGVKLMSDGNYIAKEFSDIGDYARAKAAVVTAHANENDPREVAESDSRNP